MNQMMVATKSERIFRIRWDGVEERDFSLDLKRIPFSINQQVSYGEFGETQNTSLESNFSRISNNSFFSNFSCTDIGK